MDIHLGVTENDILKRCVNITSISPLKVIKDLFTPADRRMGRVHACNLAWYGCCMFKRSRWESSRYKDKLRAKSRGIVIPPGLNPLTVINADQFRSGETPSCSIQASTRGLAKLGVPMANYGILNGKKFISYKTWEECHSAPKTVYENLLDWRSIYTKGGFFSFNNSLLKEHSIKYDEQITKYEESLFTYRDGFYGQKGMGGSLLQWHPLLNISIAYVPSDLIFLDFVHARAGRL